MRLHELEERYGMTPGSAGVRQSSSDIQNMNKRSNNKAMDQGREANIRAKSQTRRANRLGKKMATGLSQRILNPQQAQAPDQQS